MKRHSHVITKLVRFVTVIIKDSYICLPDPLGNQFRLVLNQRVNVGPVRERLVVKQFRRVLQFPESFIEQVQLKDPDARNDRCQVEEDARADPEPPSSRIDVCVHVWSTCITHCAEQFSKPKML